MTTTIVISYLLSMALLQTQKIIISSLFLLIIMSSARPKYGQTGTLKSTHSSLSMNLARHSISSTSPINIFDARFDADCNIFTATTQAGFAIYRAYPLQLIRKRGKTCLDLMSPTCLTFPTNRADRWNALCSCAIALFKSSFPAGWWSESALSSQQSYCLE